jgi:hypothetical protein
LAEEEGLSGYVASLAGAEFVSPPRGVMIASFENPKAISGSPHDLESKANYVDQRLHSRSLRSAETD